LAEDTANTLPPEIKFAKDKSEISIAGSEHQNLDEIKIDSANRSVEEEIGVHLATETES
jgi:hypothetical protein